MQRVSPRVSLIGLVLTGGLIAAMLMVFMLTIGGQGTPKAQALLQTPTPTPKPAGTGNVGGLFDINAGPGLYNCIARIDHVVPSNLLKSRATCYTQLDTGAPGGEPPCAAWHGPGPQGASPSVPIRAGEGPCVSPDTGGPDQPLMPPPPPYTAAQPTTSTGAYCPMPGPCGVIPGTAVAVPGDSSWTIGCFGDIGGTLGPNVIAVTQTLTIKVQDPTSTPGTIVTGGVWLTLAATNAACTAADAGTAPAACCGGAPISLALLRQPAARDFDGDLCMDMSELGHGQSDGVKECGNDAFNPNDAQGATPSVVGSYDVTMRITRADVGAPGKYIICKVYLAAGGTGGALCYPDDPTQTVNPAAAGNVACPPALPKFCGDGQVGAGPPGCTLGPCAALAGQGAGCPSLPCNVSQYLWAPVTKSATLSWMLSGQTLTVTWCQQFGATKDGSTPWVAINKWDVFTGVGKDIIFYGVSDADCKALVTTGSTSNVDTQTVAVRQNPGGGAGGRDSDGDGCPDSKELGTSQTAGGVRDPYNRWDFFNPEKLQTPNTQTVADILKTVGQFGKNQGNGAYTIDTDRTGILGGHAWNLGAADGQQTVADILASVSQFGHGCTP